MAIKKMPIAKFVKELEAAYKRKDGYIMGAKGQDPKKWAKNSWWFTQYTNATQKNKALYWREHAKRVWDCNGLAEGIYEDYTGVNINTKARYNYANWCGTKGMGVVPVKHRKPGVAVFIYNSNDGYITHVGYLYKPVKEDDPKGDWWVIEARGVTYGVVRTKLSARSWNRWGIMNKYFDYSDSEVDYPKALQLGDRTLKNGCEGDDVKELQEGLIRLGYSCGPKGADGDFGDGTEEAVRKFQKAKKLTVDGVFGPKSLDAFEKALVALDTTVSNPKKVKIVGGDCYIRTKSNTSGGIMGTAKNGKTYEYGGTTASNGWNSIVYNNDICWVSGKYSKLV